MKFLPLLCMFLVGGSVAASQSTSAAPVANATAAMPTAPLTRDLGRNLVYHRLRQLPHDLNAVDTARKQPRVVDVRYLASDDAAPQLQAWIKAQASPRTPIILLANATTARELIAPFVGRGGSANVVVIGAATRAFRPDIAVEISADEERRAYDALDAGVDLATLLTDNPDKVRNDEASLSRDRSSDPPRSSAANGAPKPDPLPVDAALQRAVHLHRTLVALRRL